MHLNVLQNTLFAVLMLVVSNTASQNHFPLEDSVGNKLARSRQMHIPELISLKSILNKTKADTNKVKLLIRIAETCCIYDSLYDEAVFYAEKARQLADEVGYGAGLVNAIKARGLAEEEIKKNWNAAVIFYQMAIETAREKKLSDETLDYLNSIIHNAYVYQGNFPKAMSVANDGLKRAFKRNDMVQQLHYTSLIAASYSRQNLYQNSLSEYKKAERLYEALNEDDKGASLPLVTIADINYGLADLHTTLGNADSALQLLKISLLKFNELKHDKRFKRQYMISNTLYKLGVASIKGGKLNEALEYSLAALDSCKNWACNSYEKAGYYLLAGESLRRQHNFQEAEKYLYQGKSIAEIIRHAENARDAYYYLSLFFADIKKYDSAWFYTQRYIFLKDSITNERTRFSTQQIVEMYGSAEKDRQIARQNNVRNILIASFLLTLIMLGFLYNRYRLRQHNRYQQELNRQQNELFNAISQAQEQERKRVAQDLHDSLGSVLSAAKLKLAEVKDVNPELGNDEKFLSGVSLLDEASAELRNISHNIMPATLSKLGLVPALKNLTEKISSHKGMQVVFIAYDFDSRLEEQTEISIYRIVLELINNVVKHAGATKATIQLVRYPDHINITVEDNGKGFDAGKVPEDKSGIGLGSVAARVEYLKGKIDIDSSPGKGTTVVVDVPVA